MVLRRLERPDAASLACGEPEGGGADGVHLGDLGTAAGLAVVRHPWKPVRVTLEALMYYLLVVPEIVLGRSRC